MTPLPPSRISHRAEGGPDLNYLYATAHPDEDYDDSDDEANNNNDGEAGGGTTTKKKQQQQIHKNQKSSSSSRRRRPVRRGRKSDSRTLRGTTLYLGGEEGPNSKIYCIPGHAERVLCIDTKTDEVYPVGPAYDASNMVLNGKYKWLRGIVVGPIIYGLPCHADCVLRIDTRTDEVGKIDIPYEEYFDDDDDDEVSDGEAKEEESAAHRERHRPWKYHGGAISPHDDCIYAIPQSARKVLRIDPATERCSFVGPDFDGRCKWYGGVVGKSDGAIYAIPQNATGVLRIDASGVLHDGEVSHPSHDLPPNSSEARVLVTVHGSYPPGEHKWHGAAASGSADGTIVSVPANADNVLCIVPASRAAYPPLNANAVAASSLPEEEPELYILEGRSPGDVATGRHRTDGKYKYLGAMAGTDGNVYCFPSGSERVLQIDTVERVARSVGPNLRDGGLEAYHQNKWQNGLTHVREGCVYAIPLAASSVLRVRTGPPEGGDASSCPSTEEEEEDPEVTTWKLPAPNDVLEKWEGGVIASNGCMYCMPNNHKAVLQIVPPCVPSREALHVANDAREKERERKREDRERERRKETERKKAEKEEKRRRRIERKKEGKDARANGKGEDARGGSSSAREEEKKDEDATTKNRGGRATGPTANPAWKKEDDEFTPDGVPFVYKSGIPTLRSSTHRVKYSLGHRKRDNPKPKSGGGGNAVIADDDGATNASLPLELMAEETMEYDVNEYDFSAAVADVLRGCDAELVGSFRQPPGGAPPRLEDFAVPPNSMIRKCQKGDLQQAQEHLSEAVCTDAKFLEVFDGFVVERVLPRFKERLREAGVVGDGEGDGTLDFYYQRPPTLRIQPGPARASVRAHNDAEYGHQNGELNFWLPLTSRRETGVDLLCESAEGAGDYRPLKADPGQVTSFHGSSCRHYVKANHSTRTRVSLDFRVGVEGYFDAQWQMAGTTNDHSRRKVAL